MKYSKRKDKYCCNVLNDNFHEIDDRLNNLENGGGGSGGGGGCNIVYLTQEEYDALPASKESDDVEYRITNANTSVNAARDWAYDNRLSKLEAANVQDAIDEVNENVSTLNNSLNGLSVIAVTSESFTIAGGGGSIAEGTVEINTNKKVLGIVGYKFNANSGNVFYNLYIENKTIKFSARNYSQSANTQTATFYVLVI